MKNDTSGPAFPTEVPEDPNGGFGRYVEGGLSIRDYFAAAALTGNCSLDDVRTPQTQEDRGDIPAWRAKIHKQDATYCYEMADAMLAARQPSADPEPPIPSSDQVPF